MYYESLKWAAQVCIFVFNQQTQQSYLKELRVKQFYITQHELWLRESKLSAEIFLIT